MVTSVKTQAPPQAEHHCEKRAFKRYKITQNATVQFADSTSRACIARDVCTGGMYLTYDENRESTNAASPASNDSVNITCAISLDGQNTKNLLFSGDIVRVECSGFAVRFIDPDLGSLLVIQEHAKAEQKKQNKIRSENEEKLKNKIFNGKTAAQLIHECNKKLEAVLDPTIISFMDVIVDNLFKASKETKSTLEMNAYYDALKTFSQKKDDMRATFRSAALKQLENNSPSAVKQDPATQIHNYNLDTLSIIENEDFDDWLADTTTVDSIESRCRGTLSEIEKRLSILHETEINKANNPYGPALFTKAFHKATNTLEMKHSINMVFYSVFKDILLFNLSDFYLKLNKFLKDNDILPIIRHKIPRPKMQEVKKNKEPTSEQKTVEIEPSSSTDISGSQQYIHNELDLYELVGELRSLQHQISEQNGISQVKDTIQNKLDAVFGSENDQANTESIATESYTSDELHNALSVLVADAAKQPQSIDKTIDYKTAALAALKKNAGTSAEKNIGVRENRIIDVASNIFQSMIDDMCVSEKVRDWIKQLELPVLTMALTDETVFTNRNHIVREVINKIAQLEVLIGESDQADLPIIKRAIDWIIELVTTEFNGSIEVFSRAIHQLDILLKSQDETYSKNITSVVNKYSAEERNIEENNKVEEVRNEVRISWDDIDDKESDLWIKKAKRLKDGDWLLFDPESVNPIRLRIAWFAPNTLRFVLVNLIGIKDRILHVTEMAKLLHDGKVSLIYNASEPAMDRAQYSMLQDLHAKLLYQNTHDPVTGLISRREFQNKVELAINEAKHNKTRHAICFIDLDQFNIINNACGYEGGDKLLKDVAELFSGCIGDQGIVSRITSDEFAVILNNFTLDDAIDTVEEILDALSEYRFIWNKKRLSTTCSVGLVPISLRNTQDSSTLLQQAEASCRVAKDYGGNRIQVYSKEHEKLSKRTTAMKWAVAIDRIIEEETLYLRCQRIIPLDSTQDKEHYELLLGVWNSEGGDISTPEFIEAAERYRRMPDVDRWVIKNAFRWIAAHHASLEHIGVFSINLSGLSLNDDTFKKFVIDEMQATKVPADKICFEVTETAGVSSLSDASEFIVALKETGCEFSLDDFGTGMSSYAYLKNMPVDYLKIDGTFVKDMINNPCDFAVVKSICEIGQFMGKKIIAEFVENDEILETLRKIGVNYGQGYGIERPRMLKDLK